MVEVSEEEYKRFENFKIYQKNYFQAKLRNKYSHCNCCNTDVLYHSYSNHLKSKKHLEKLKNI